MRRVTSRPLPTYPYSNATWFTINLETRLRYEMHLL